MIWIYRFMGCGNPTVAADPHPAPPIWSPGLSSFIFHLIQSFNLSTFHLSKINVSIFHLQSAIRLFQRTGRLGHVSLSCMHESVIPLEHKQHSTQTLKYVDKNFPPAHPLGYMQLHGLTLRRLRLEHASYWDGPVCRSIICV